MITIPIDENVTLELTSAKHAGALYEAVNANRKHLSEFLPWVGNMQSVADFQQYIETCEMLYRQGKEVSFVILLNEVAVGRIGLHHVNPDNKNASIGYWLTKEAEGKGIIIRSCRKLIAYGFDELQLHRIEIKAAVKNIKSRAIPEKLNFKEEGTLRDAELVNGVYLDLVLYSILQDEWK
jgi:ribosomal-protein-serine acetyltransferase